MQSEFKPFCQKRTDGRVYRKMTKTKAEHFAADLKNRLLTSCIAGRSK